MRVAVFAAVTTLVLAPAGGTASRSAISPASAKAADAKIDEAIALERKALTAVGKHDVLPHVYLYQSVDKLQEARALIKGRDGADPIVKDLSDAVGDDHDAISHQSDKPPTRSLESIRKALALKKKAQGLLTNYLVGGGKVCESEKAFPLYAVPATYSASYGDVYPHNVPKDAKDLEIHFVNAATRKPAPAHPFPGQSWTAKIVGFETRGGEPVLHVHIDVTGEGIGKPDEDFVNWKAVVSWSC
jgi:hypothetical protein